MRVLALSFIVFSGIGMTCFAQAGVSSLSGQEVKFFNLVNQFRQILNVPVLSISEPIQAAARNHSIWMVNQDSLLDPDTGSSSALSHYGPTRTTSPFQRMTLQGYSDFKFAGENISCGNGDATKTFQQFAFSPQHLVNLINSHFRDTGIAREGTGDENCPFYWTHDFGTQQELSKDGPTITDISLIRNAIIAVSGPIPSGKFVALPTQAPADPAPGPTVMPAQNDSRTRQQAFNQLNKSGMSVSSQIAPVQSLQCLIPYAAGKQLITPYQNTDTFLQAKKTSSNTYSVTLSYFLNGELTLAAPIVTESVTITQSPDFPVVTLFVAPGSKLGGFMIQVNTQSSQGQFDSYGVSPGVSAELACTVN